MPSDDNDLVRESAWARGYRVAPNTYLYESKFQSDGVNISFESFQQMWASLADDDRLDFAFAFSQKGIFCKDDQKTMHFLMSQGSEMLDSIIAFRMPELDDREEAINFLLERVEREAMGMANYYQGLARIGDRRAQPYLELHFHLYKERLLPIEDQDFHALFNYLECCSSLAHLTHEVQYKAEMERLTSHPDPKVQRIAKAKLARL